MTIPEDHQDTSPVESGNTSGDDGPIPLMQRILDNPFLLLAIGVASPAVLYLIWGVIEIVQIPIGN